VFNVRIRMRIPQDYARAKHNSEGVNSVREDQRSYWFSEQPGPAARISRREAMDEKSINIGPIHGLLVVVPQNALAATVAGREDASGLARRAQST
jgi:hypothetical protein